MYSKIVNIIYVNIQKNLYRYSIKRIIILNESVIKRMKIKDLKHECILGARSAIDALAPEAQEAQIPFNPYLLKQYKMLTHKN